MLRSRIAARFVTSICGGYNTKTKPHDTKKTFTVQGSKYQVSLDFIKINSWFVRAVLRSLVIATSHHHIIIVLSHHYHHHPYYTDSYLPASFTHSLARTHLAHTLTTGTTTTYIIIVTSHTPPSHLLPIPPRSLSPLVILRAHSL